MNFRKLLKANPNGFDIKKHDPGYKGNLRRQSAERLKLHQLTELQKLQEKLFADGTKGVLLVIQGMDASGKDGIVKHVISGLNPAGCNVTAFKVPSEAERKHGYLWRAHAKVPGKGEMAIFVRSYYEDVLVVRVHPALLDTQFLPKAIKQSSSIWKKRYRDINQFEEYLLDNGIRVVKIFLHMSKKEQAKRFLARLTDPTKHWKFSKADIAERKFWNNYQRCFQEMIRQTSTPASPWFVVPADNKWFAQAAVSGILVDTLREMNPKFPKTSDKQERQIKKLCKKLKKQLN